MDQEEPRAYIPGDQVGAEIPHFIHEMHIQEVIALFRPEGDYEHSLALSGTPQETDPPSGFGAEGTKYYSRVMLLTVILVFLIARPLRSFCPIGERPNV